MKAMYFAVTLILLLQTPLHAAEPHKDIMVISNEGQEVHLSSLLSTNRITLVDFYADWCGPCKAISPYLEALARDDAQVQLIKIDIKTFESPVAKQYGIGAVPNIRVYKPDGSQVGKDSSSFGTVKLYVKKAKRQLEK